VTQDEAENSLGSSSSALDGGLSLIGDLARSRREKAQQESDKPRPAFVEAVEQSEVLYIFDPLAIPSQVLEPSVFVDFIAKAYGSKLEPLNIAPLLDKMSREEVMKLDEEGVILELVRRGVGELAFGYGKFPLRNDFVVIRKIAVNSESILANIVGVTSVAETIAAEVGEFLWRAAGVTKQWPEIAKRIKITGYGTATRVKLDFPTERLLNPKLVQYVRDNLTEGQNIGSRFGRIRKDLTVDSRIAAVASLDELHLKVDRFDLTTGATESNAIRFSVTARNDYGVGRLLVTSPMAYAQHEEFLKQLFGVIRDEA
jgi:hypothetical protein